MRAVRRRLKARPRGLRNICLQEMQTAGRVKIQTPFFAIAVQKSPVSLVVNPEDESRIPEKYWYEIPATKQLDKQVIKDALLGGEAVPGCELRPGYHLRIR